MLKFALVGCGRIARRHSELLGLCRIEGATLVAACDSDAAQVADIGKQFSIIDLTEMQLVAIDVVVVLTESGNHHYPVEALHQLNF
jgi:UDP-N-acetyl-2-amino-2-deoxyglucuronate dehydrogenase